MLALLNAIFWSLFTRSLRPSLSSESPTKATEFSVKTTDCMNNGDNHGPETHVRVRNISRARVVYYRVQTRQRASLRWPVASAAQGRRECSRSVRGGHLAGWLLPPVFGNLRRLLEARMGKAGKREYVQVLRLIESFSLDDVRAAISEALERGVIGFDAVKHLVLCRIEKRPPRLNLLAHPYLPRAEVATTSARSSMGLLKGAAP